MAPFGELTAGGARGWRTHEASAQEPVEKLAERASAAGLDDFSDLDEALHAGATAAECVSASTHNELVRHDLEQSAMLSMPVYDVR